VVLTVRDQGSGLPDGQCERVFERFYRADAARAKKGSGLGLAIVAAVVEAHGGRVAAANPAGGGAEFTVRLPAALPVATAGATALSGT
jgi:signal transduction histidine kinase